jgi:hypothetical protein
MKPICPYSYIISIKLISLSLVNGTYTNRSKLSGSGKISSSFNSVVKSYFKLIG